MRKYVFNEAVQINNLSKIHLTFAAGIKKLLLVKLNINNVIPIKAIKDLIILNLLLIINYFNLCYFVLFLSKVLSLNR